MDVSPDELIFVIGLKEAELFLLRRQVVALQKELEAAKKPAEAKPAEGTTTDG